MTVTRIVIPDDFPTVFGGHPAVERLRGVGAVKIYGERAATGAALRERLRDATAVINVRAYTRFDADLLAALPHLRLIAISGTGTDNVDLEAATREGVAVANTPGANARSVAEHTLALLLAVARRIPISDRETHAGHWRHHPGLELEGKTLGVVGLGAIGSRVARMAAALDMRVLAWSIHQNAERARACGAELVELDTLLRRSDVVTLHLRATPQARGIIGARELALMRSGSILINTARAALVDQQALLAALRAGQLMGAGLDVHDPEPLPAGSPFFDLETAVLTPHVGWVTHEASERLIQIPIDIVLAYLAGEPRSIVNPDVLSHPRQRMAQSP